MSRILEWNGDDDDEWAALRAGRWERNSRVVFKSKRGQKALRDIEAALLALPEPRLVESLFSVTEETLAHMRKDFEEMDEPIPDVRVGDVCVLGALARARGVEEKVPVYFQRLVDGEPESDADEEARWAAEHLGITFTLAWTLMDWNDEAFGGLSPEQRYERMLAFVRKNIAPAERAVV